MSSSYEKSRAVRNLGGEQMPKKSLVASSSQVIPHKTLKRDVPLKQLRGKNTDKIALFCLEVAVLETVRRFSKAKCPFVWKYVQALQVVGYPPLKWIQRWTPLRGIVKAVQKLSRPLLCLSIATAFSDSSETHKREDTSPHKPQPDSELPSGPSNIRKLEESDVTTKEIDSDNWLPIIIEKLNKEGISIPERIDKDELRRFYTITKGDLSCLLSTLKKTIHWRETYHFLSLGELEIWSTLVFWHELDVMHRPCLVIRLGLACSTLSSHDRPLFAQAIVSQLEHGILHLVNEADPRVTVLIDCEGLSPFRFPMQILKTCCTLIQDNYPCRLVILYIVRLPPVARVIAQTFIKVLKPETREKLRIKGEAYLNALSIIIQSVPRFLGGNCTCSICKTSLSQKEIQDRSVQGTNNEEEPCTESLLNENAATQNPFFLNHDHLRAAVLGFLMLWVIIACTSRMIRLPNPLVPW